MKKQPKPKKMAGTISATVGQAYANRLLILTEMLALLYIIITGIILLVMRPVMPDAGTLLLNRVEIVVGMGIFALLYYRAPSRFTWALRIIFQLMLLSYWYPETYLFNRHFDNLDHLFAQIEQVVCLSQPAVWFHQLFSHWIISELLHFGYFVYYALIVGVILFYYISNYRQAERVAFVLFGSFYVYYLIYTLLPVAGPQFYFPAIGWESVAAGRFPPVGKFFASHPELLEMDVAHQGLFYRLVNMSQQMGERPTAAFPSSHVGITTVIFAFVHRGSRKLFWSLLPIGICLMLATVYIQAHYFIDVLAGLATGLLFYYSGNKLYSWLDIKISGRRSRNNQTGSV
ncbi:phosphatase PAP2 family protein [Porphyromonas loveana]|uniref:phosphatase PAP2 family protein n=1 Tax=Porphyromonas loveana TaxID=1884669 RepID=UPI0035A146AB